MYKEWEKRRIKEGLPVVKGIASQELLFRLFYLHRANRIHFSFTKLVSYGDFQSCFIRMIQLSVFPFLGANSYTAALSSQDNRFFASLSYIMAQSWVTCSLPCYSHQVCGS